MTSSGSLRDTYSSPNSAWTFQPSPIIPPNSSSSSSSPSAPGREWSMRVNASPVFDLSPSLSYDEAYGVKLDVKGMVHSFIGTFVLQYGGTAIAMPWEVAKILLQIQWNPRVGGSLKRQEESTLEEELSEDSSDEAYFQDPTSSSPTFPPPKLRHVDEKGYIVRKSVLEESTRPEYVIPLTNTNGIWSMIKKIARYRNEGWLSLWKGLLTSCIINTLSTTIQPILQEVLISIFPSPDTSPPSLLIPIASHLVTGLLLSPLDLVRTRLICQSSMPRHRTYTGPIHALSQLIQYEGGIKGLYFHPHLFIPALLDNTARPFANYVLPVLIATRTGITPDTHPFLVVFGGIIAGCLTNVIVSPFETVRRRLQIQSRGLAAEFKACVETRPRPYHGVVDAMWRIITEERSEIPVMTERLPTGVPEKEPEDTDEGWITFSGIGQLYHGFGLNAGAVIAISLLTAFGGDEESGWTEL
ncbi:hypothetical protein Clacol_003034 [Clathrus columnatus]|uniref:Mitochondrial carrier n=1 Tax=Clathrus columnatus TaxID=1419009 RepID=A0AAV5AA66_9AGAM|nr:hypothetical protein Clacol_003034 [Clathrus columnatus]